MLCAGCGNLRTDNVWWCAIAPNNNKPCTGSGLQLVFKRLLRWLGLMEAPFIDMAFTSLSETVAPAILRESASGRGRGRWLSVCCAGGCMSEEGSAKTQNSEEPNCLLTYNTNRTAWRLRLTSMEDHPSIHELERHLQSTLSNL